MDRPPGPPSARPPEIKIYIAVKLVQKRLDMIGEKARCFLQCKATLMAPSRQVAFFGHQKATYPSSA